MGDLLVFNVSGRVVSKINNDITILIFCHICYTCLHFIEKLPRRLILHVYNDYCCSHCLWRLRVVLVL